MRLNLPAAPRRRLAMTSLVDVVFILLFFFMLASQQLDWRGLEVDLRTLQPGGTPEAEAASAVALVLEDGRLRWRGQSWEVADLVLQLRAKGLKRLVLVPMPGLQFQPLVSAMDALTGSGLIVELGRVEPLP